MNIAIYCATSNLLGMQRNKTMSLLTMLYCIGGLFFQNTPQNVGIKFTKGYLVTVHNWSYSFYSEYRYQPILERRERRDNKVSRRGVQAN